MGDITIIFQSDFETLAREAASHVTADLVLWAFVFTVLAITCGNVLARIIGRAWERLCGR